MKIRTDERIRVMNGYDKDSYTYIPVIIVGAGESGIAAACQLKQQLGFDQFRCYDRQAGFGGTWWINRYPGVACDIPTPYYSFSWRQNKEATELYPTGPELIRYLQKVAAEYGVVDKFSLNTDVSELRWLREEKLWQATLRYMSPGTGDLSKSDREKLIQEKGEQAVYLGSEIIRAKVAISCVGGLVEPRSYPEDVKGWENFKGDIFHTARWKGDADLAGKDVVVVGTGCSAAQTVPELTSSPYNARSVTHVMRTAPWVQPKMPEPFGKEWYSKHAAWWYKNIPGLHASLRAFIATSAELTWFQYFGASEWNAQNRKALAKASLDHMHKHAPEKYHGVLTPNFDIGCKRRIFDHKWYKSLHDPKVQLTTQKLTSIGDDSVLLKGGGISPERQDDPTGQSDWNIHADAIVLANGFDTTKWLHPMKVVGKHGRSLHDVWHERGGAQAYMGSTMDGFPNLFIIFGPNTATGHQSVILASENMVNYSIKFIKQILEGDVETFEVKEEAEISWTQRIQRDCKNTVFHVGGCMSWYFEGETGWNSTTYPRSQIDHTLRCMFPTWSDYDIAWTQKGSIRKRVSQALRLLVAVTAVVGVYRLRQGGARLKDLPTILKMSAKMGLMSLLGSVSAGAESLQERLF